MSKIGQHIPEFRAYISKDVVIDFTFADLADFGSLVTNKPKLEVRELLMPWLKQGNIPMQFTGVKDKKGVEIVQGDILKYEYKENKSYYLVYRTEYNYKFRIECLRNCNKLMSPSRSGLGAVANNRKMFKVVSNPFQATDKQLKEWGIKREDYIMITDTKSQ